MIGVLPSTGDPRPPVREAFATALAKFDRVRPVTVLGHFDADGLSAVAILVRALTAAGWQAMPRITGKGETPWDADFAATLARPGGLIVADLGTRAEPVLPGVPTIVIDHHLPTGTPAGATRSAATA